MNINKNEIINRKMRGVPTKLPIFQLRIILIDDQIDALTCTCNFLNDMQVFHNHE